MKVNTVPKLNIDIKKRENKHNTEFSKELGIALDSIMSEDDCKLMVPFTVGMRVVSRFPGVRLYSTGLDSDEYIEYVRGKGMCYEDGCVIAEFVLDAIEVLNNLGWVKNHEFYIYKNKPLPAGVTMDTIMSYIAKIK